MNKKVYTINHTTWWQKQLTWLEDQRVLDIIKTYVGDLPTDEIGFSRAIDRLYNSVGMVEFMKIVLKPSTSLYNRFLMWKHKMSPEKVLTVMTKSDIALVLVDFFVLRREWQVDCMNSQKNAVSSLNMKDLPKSIRSEFEKHLSDSQGVTTN